MKIVEIKEMPQGKVLINGWMAVDASKYDSADIDSFEQLLTKIAVVVFGEYHQFWDHTGGVWVGQPVHK